MASHTTEFEDPNDTTPIRPPQPATGVEANTIRQDDPAKMHPQNASEASGKDKNIPVLNQTPQEPQNPSLLLTPFF